MSDKLFVCRFNLSRSNVNDKLKEALNKYCWLLENIECRPFRA
jgi:hypothetical protein